MLSNLFLKVEIIFSILEKDVLTNLEDEYFWDLWDGLALLGRLKKK